MQDSIPTFLEDSSGLDWADGYLWAVDNGTGTFYKLTAQADGSVTFADGWERGKRVRYAKDADDPSAAGPDAEGITMAGDGNVYIASERGNSNKGVNYDVLLQVNPDAAESDVVASAEWDLTSQLPSVSANMGIEAVEWVPNSMVDGALWDANTKAPFESSNYHGIVDGVFFVALEDNGHVYAFVLNSDGTAQLISDIDAGIGGAMGLNYLQSEGILYVESDDGYDGRIAAVTLNGTSEPAIVQYSRPAGMPNVNNEGFAISEQCVDQTRAAWFFQDGAASGALRSIQIPCTAEQTEDPDNTETPGGEASESATVQTSQGQETPGHTSDGSATEVRKALPHTGTDSAGLMVIAAVLVAAGGALTMVRRWA